MKSNKTWIVVVALVALAYFFLTGKKTAVVPTEADVKKQMEDDEEIKPGKPGSKWIKGGTENSFKTFPNLVDLAYGVSNSFSYKRGVKGMQKFNNVSFDDPAPGFAKFWYYKDVDPNNDKEENGVIKPLRAGSLWKLGDNKGKPGVSKSFAKPVDLAYGSGNKFAYKWKVKNTVVIDDNLFGGSPDPETPSAWYYQEIETPLVDLAPDSEGSDWIGEIGGSPIDNNETCSFNFPVDLAYGNSGDFCFKTNVPAGYYIFEERVFGDPNSRPPRDNKGYFRPTTHIPADGMGTQEYKRAASISDTVVDPVYYSFNYKNPNVTGLYPSEPGHLWLQVFDRYSNDPTKGVILMEGATIDFGDLIVDVAYGDNTYWAFKLKLTGKVILSEKIFGDPSLGVKKYYYFRLSDGKKFNTINQNLTIPAPQTNTTQTNTTQTNTPQTNTPQTSPSGHSFANI